MAVGIHRPTVLTIDLEAIRYNVKTAKDHLQNGAELFMVVKANGYGHGLVQTAMAAKEAGATGFCVAILDEAIELRQSGFTDPILVLGITSPEYAHLMVEQKIAAAVGSLDWLQQAERNLEGIPGQLLVHLAVDTGMGRIGFRETDDLMGAVDFLSKSQSLTFEGIFTHFATADMKDNRYFQGQLSKWQAMTAELPELPKYVHISNSATTLWHHPLPGINMIRYGAAGYGLNPSGTELQPPFDLHPAMSLTSEIVFSKQIHAGDSVGYGATYTAKQDEFVGTLPIGYADGYQRRLGGFYVLVDGQKCDILGRVCMDQIMIRLPKFYQPGTKVTLVGRNGSKEISLQDLADHLETNHYEIACGFSDRITKKYVH
ncbi:alanine racemase [Secundilactobacillus oryzae JCM 18671]|uniref:Alanine racemase n=1 Tax=Secundilactobacillus oryzae JCM 18671 TaxID=1291743 RepID=A0A081BH34_9LACO|nr:alanine racemase [Secundilactobacillus oryzae]GAK47352.1 alanine racemase [Secundilactobacillus oryzae JCM 18671]